MVEGQAHRDKVAKAGKGHAAKVEDREIAKAAVVRMAGATVDGASEATTGVVVAIVAASKARRKSISKS